jgi:mono/diheme cytochrome c family protein
MLESRSRLLPGVAVGVLLCSLSASAHAGGADGKAVDHPRIPGFGRFLASREADAARGGRLLLGELNCTACHQASGSAEARILRKQAPILDTVGSRIKPAYLRAFLNDPHGEKPGTTMPDLLAGLPEAQRKETVEALVHFLASTGGISETRLDRPAVPRGKKLYHQVGCVACHGPQESTEPPLSTTVPLGNLAAKYTVASLSAFLRDPLRARPSGRMPGLSLDGTEASDVASYLLRDLKATERPNLAYQYFEGSWSTVPDFDGIKPVATGRAVGFDLTLAHRPDNFALKFEGDLQVNAAGDYVFHLTSDDGSKLWIDGQLVVNNDGIHANQETSGGILLTKGTHRLVVGYFDGGGETELEVEYEGRGVRRQPVSSALSPAAEPAPAPEEPRGASEPFRVEADLARKGRTLFTTIGCASCHQLRENDKPIESTLTALPLDRLKTEGGCLARVNEKGHAMYALSEPQRKALAAAIGAHADPPADPPSASETVAQVLTTFNCYACHQREGLGGVEETLNPFFTTTQKEMGDEGRIPPHLNGVGAKLAPDYLRSLFRNGGKDRPYMLTRMPRFGEANVGRLVAAFDSLDKVEPVEVPEFDLPPRRVKSDGRFLVGGEALSCIKCHTFKGIRAEGVQAIDMTILTRRLNRDWFHRYLLDPQAYRPGTRMPAAWPMGQSLLPKVLEGETRRQIEAIWLFLSDGAGASEPSGLVASPIPLVAENEAILYRNFIRGAGPRAIGVGYPEKANIAFDANDLRLALIWQGAFIDASRHWSGRGEGFQPPLGDNVVALPAGQAFASLKSGTDPWPDERSRSSGQVFRGYRLGKDQKPTFLYDVGPVHVEDFPDPIPGTASKVATLRRTLTLTAPGPVANLWFRAAVADKIEPGPDGWFTVNADWKIKIEAESTPVVRSSGGKAELLVLVELHDKPVAIVEVFSW